MDVRGSRVERGIQLRRLVMRCGWFSSILAIFKVDRYMAAALKLVEHVNLRSRILLRALVLFAVLGCASLTPAFAQGASPIPVKEFEMTDQNGVVLATAQQLRYASNGQTYTTYEGAKVYSVRIPEPSVSIGDPRNGGLSWESWRRATAPDFYSVNPMPAIGTEWGGFGSLSGMIVRCPHTESVPGYISFDVSVGSSVENFTSDGTTVYSTQRTGSSLTESASQYVYRRADGSQIVYDKMGELSYCSQPPELDQWARIVSITKPDGEVITYNYSTVSLWYGNSTRLQSVTNNLGYQIHFQYERDSAATAAEYALTGRLKKVTAIDNALNPCSPVAFTCSDSVGANWPYLLYGYESGGTVQTITDRLGNVSRYFYSGNIQPGSGSSTPIVLTAYRSPAATSDDVTIQWTTTTLTVQNAVGTWVYGHAASNGSYTMGDTATVSGSNGYSRSVLLGVAGGPAPSAVSVDTLNGRSTNYSYSYYGTGSTILLSRVTGHEGDYVEYEYDGRRNVTRVREVGKPGSGLADIYQYASYPELGAAVCVNAKTCNKPAWVTVAGPASGTPSSLPKTSYTYDAAHGGLLTETRPAPGSGPYAAIAPQTRYTYAVAGGVTRVATAKSCRTTASCAGTADETVVETTYNAKRTPSLVVTRAGNNATSFTATNTRVATTYSPQGDVESIDGPLSGTVDTVWNYYDTMRRLRVTVAPDPDAAGSLIRRATRTTYDADGQPTMIEQGSDSTPTNCSAANNFCATTMTVRGGSGNLHTGLGGISA